MSKTIRILTSWQIIKLNLISGIFSKLDSIFCRIGAWNRVHKNIIIIEDLSETHRRPTYLIRDPSETEMPDQRPIGDLEMLHRRPIWNRHAPSEIDMIGLKPTCLIRDQHAYLIGDTLETYMPNQIPTRDRHAWLKFFHYSNIYK